MDGASSLAAMRVRGGPAGRRRAVRRAGCGSRRQDVERVGERAQLRQLSQPGSARSASPGRRLARSAAEAGARGLPTRMACRRSGSEVVCPCRRGRRLGRSSDLAADGDVIAPDLFGGERERRRGWCRFGQRRGRLWS